MHISAHTSTLHLPPVQPFVQPSFNLVTEGTDLMKESLLSPFLQQNLDNFGVFVVADKVYRFGELKGLK